MSRPLRINQPHIPFHVLNRGDNKEKIFHDDEDYIYYLKLIGRYKSKFKLKLYHFSLMPNHVHFQIEPMIENTLSKFMQCLTIAHTVYVNRKYNRVGHVWQGRFKSSIIGTDVYFLRCGFYIELNAKRANLVHVPEEWRWSSYRFYIGAEKDGLIKNLIDLDPFYLSLSDAGTGRQKEYKRLVNSMSEPANLQYIKKQLDIGVYGSDEFIKKIREDYGIKQKRKAGRPCKIVNNQI